MSMQQALGAVGFVVGAYFGYPQLGFVVGSLVGAALTPKTKTEGPRLDDLKVTVSTYGAGVPTLNGTDRLGGNFIWATDKYQEGTTESTGKGGGTENTTYRTFIDCRIGLCETPRDGSTVSVLQMFSNGKMVYDASSGISIGSALASAENPVASGILYQGDAAQLPDPTEEAHEGGPGSVSAYRGLVSYHVNHLECPNGQVPQLSFVLSTSASIVNEIHTSADFYFPKVSSAISKISIDKQTVVFGQTAASTAAIGVMGIDFGSVTNFVPAVPNSDNQITQGDSDQDLMVVQQNSGTADSAMVLMDEYGGLTAYRVGSDFHCDGSRTNASWALRGNWVAFGGVTATDDVILLYGKDLGFSVGSCIATGQQKVMLTDSYLWVVYASTLEIRDLDGALTSLASASFPGSFSGHYTLFAYGAIDTLYCLLNAAGRTQLWAATRNGSSITFTLQGEMVRGDNSIPFPLVYPVKVDRGNVYAPLIVDASGGASEYTIYELVYLLFNQLSASDVKVKNVIAELCERAGETRYDVSGIPDSDTLHGYKLTNPASARSNIQPLLDAFGIFIVDEDGLIKFKKYSSITSLATITYDELGQSEAGSDAGDAMPLSRKQEIDLPRSVTASYIEAAIDYQTASEPSERQVTEATEDQQIELPMVINSDQAKSAANRILYAAWNQQNTRSCKVSRKYAWLSCGDGVTVEYPRGSFRLWRIMSLTDDGLTVELNVEPGDAAIFNQTAIGSTGYVGQEVDPLPAPLRAQILDMPIVRDADNNAGPYVALDSFGSVPAEGELFVGDDDTVLASRGTVSQSAPIGYGETALASGPIGLVDETNLFTVNIGDDTFTSVTRDVLLAGGGEYWAYGAPGRWEIGASASGDNLGGGRYTLSRHLRGLFGTERFTGTHVAGDAFVLLRIVGMLRPDTGVGGIGQTKSYRAVAKGASLNSAASQTYANTGEGLMPLSPINLRRTDTNDFTVDRRSRLAMNNATGALPIGETTEAYLWAFYSSGAFTTLLGTVATITSTVTAAQITAIGVTPSATAFLKVRQVSDSVGPGHELQATA